MTDDLNMVNEQLAGRPETAIPSQAEAAPAEQTPETAAAAGQAQPEPAAENPASVEGAMPAEQPAAAQAKPAETATPAEEAKSDKMDWYILKVQSNREDSIREGLMRRVAIAGLGYFFGEIIVPTEKVTEFKGGKKKIIKRKLYPGYLVAHMEINDDTWFLVRETPGIGDFTGAAGRPSPMLPHEVARIVAKQEEKSEKAPKLKIAFREGERVKIKEGTFENFEGDVDSIDETNGRVTVMINIFGRSTPVELEYWQIETL
ncbi:MAG: transcription termination/antitermination protein NusG [Thermoguttaceae bacterium]